MKLIGFKIYSTEVVAIGVNILVVLTLNKFFKELNIIYIIKQIIKIANSE